MRRVTAALLAASLFCDTFAAARASAQAASPFPEVPLPSSNQGPHLAAYTCMVAGVGLIGASYLLEGRANDRYAEYLHATDPDQITHLYNETVTLDRLSSGALIGGELLIGTGLYLRFLRRPPTSRFDITLAPERCALSYRF